MTGTCDRCGKRAVKVRGRWRHAGLDDALRCTVPHGAMTVTTGTQATPRDEPALYAQDSLSGLEQPSRRAVDDVPLPPFREEPR